jgi:Domain of unknown function (DUF4214)
MSSYMAYLLRPADPDGLTYWSGQFINQGRTTEELISGFLAAPEYFQRATM